MRMILIGFLVWGFSLPALAIPRTDAQLQAQVIRSLRTRHGSFFKQLQALKETKRVSVILGQVVLDSKQLPHVRGRAIIALRTFDKNLGIRVYKKILVSPKQVTSLLRRSLRSLSMLSPAEAIPYATKAIHHQDITIRKVAVDALAKQPSSETLWLIQQRAKIETRVYLKKILKVQILQLQKVLQATPVRPTLPPAPRK